MAHEAYSRLSVRFCPSLSYFVRFCPSLSVVNHKFIILQFAHQFRHMIQRAADYELSILRKIGSGIASPFRALHRALDLRDVLLLGGLAMLGRGLYVKCGEWLALVVCGILLMVIGYLMRSK